MTRGLWRKPSLILLLKQTMDCLLKSTKCIYFHNQNFLAGMVRIHWIDDTLKQSLIPVYVCARHLALSASYVNIVPIDVNTK